MPPLLARLANCAAASDSPKNSFFIVSVCVFAGTHNDSEREYDENKSDLIRGPHASRTAAIFSSRGGAAKRPGDCQLTH